jgi:hypothetical protein
LDSLCGIVGLKDPERAFVEEEAIADEGLYNEDDSNQGAMGFSRQVRTSRALAGVGRNKILFLIVAQDLGNGYFSHTPSENPTGKVTKCEAVQRDP